MQLNTDILFRHSNVSITSELKKEEKIIIKQMSVEKKSCGVF